MEDVPSCSYAKTPPFIEPTSSELVFESGSKPRESPAETICSNIDNYKV